MVNRRKVTLHVYKFSDHENVLEILKNRSRREVKRFNSFLWRVEQTPRLSARMLNERIKSDQPGQDLLRVLELYKNLPTRHELFPEACIRLINSGAISEFEKLDKDVQHQVWNMHYFGQTMGFQSCADRAYLRLLNMTGIPPMLASYNEEDIDSYMENARANHFLTKGESARRSRPIDLWTPNYDFIKNIYTVLRDQRYTSAGTETQPRFAHATGAALHMLEPYRAQIILMLRALYGEDKIFEIFNHFQQSEQFLCADDILNLLEEWDDLKEYPAEWIQHMKGLKH